jgi:cytochrome c peroxidase
MQKARRVRLIILYIAVLSVVAFWFMRTFTSEHSEGPVIDLQDNIALEQERAEFGRMLFFDKRLSKDNSISCMTCHLPGLAFTDGKEVSTGFKGRMGVRNAPTLLNVKDYIVFMFDAHIDNLEEQSIVPIQDTNEMAMRMGDLITKLRGDVNYSKLSRRLFRRELDAWVITRALASYERTLVSVNSSFDRFYKAKDSSQLSKRALKGWELFNEHQCISCHSLPHFTNSEARNNGFFESYEQDPGRFRIFNDSNDIGKFKVPTLRNIVLTAPYMHDGSVANLDMILEQYSKGGSGHFNQDQLVKPFDLSNNDKECFEEFFKSLTDTSYLRNF